MVPDAARLAWNTAKWSIYRPVGTAAVEGDAFDSAVASTFAAEADAAAEAAIASAGALAVGMFIFAVTLTEPIYYCCDICPFGYQGEAADMSVDPQQTGYPMLCTNELGHGGEHVCSDHHNWIDSPIGFNQAERALAH